LKRLILVRHGETEWNRQHRYQGQAGLPLNEVGLQQAGLLAARLESEDVDVIYASDLDRAVQTAQVIAGRHGLPVRVDQRLREMSFGDWEGLSYAEIRAGWPDGLNAWVNDSLSAAPPGGETLAEVAARMQSFLDDVIVRGGRAILVVSHGGPLRVLLCLALGLDVQAHWRFRIDTASVSELQVYTEDAVLVRMNDTCHLQDVAMSSG